MIYPLIKLTLIVFLRDKIFNTFCNGLNLSLRLLHKKRPLLNLGGFGCHVCWENEYIEITCSTCTGSIPHRSNTPPPPHTHTHTKFCLLASSFPESKFDHT